MLEADDSFNVLRAVNVSMSVIFVQNTTEQQGPFSVFC